MEDRMKNRMNQTIYGPQEVYRATGGYGTMALQRDWRKRGLFSTPLAEPRAGKSRQFSRLALVEAVFLAECARRGLGVATAAAAFHQRLVQAARAAGVLNDIEARNYVFAQTDMPALRPHLPDLLPDPPEIAHATSYVWLVNFQWSEAEGFLAKDTVKDLGTRVHLDVFKNDEIPIQKLTLTPVIIMIGITACIQVADSRIQRQKDQE